MNILEMFNSFSWPSLPNNVFKILKERNTSESMGKQYYFWILWGEKHVYGGRFF